MSNSSASDVQQGIWTAEEDNQLKDLVKTYGNQWQKIGEEIRRHRGGKRITVLSSMAT